jgi:hypothetical protein
VFEHKSLDGQKLRVVSSTQGFVPEILEVREPPAGRDVAKAGRLQHAVVSNTLVSRYLPPESMGLTWPNDANGEPWWEVVNHPPHGGVVAEFNRVHNGAYPRVLDPKHQVVAYASAGEEVLIANGRYSVTRAADKKRLEAPDLGTLRSLYCQA